MRQIILGNTKHYLIDNPLDRSAFFSEKTITFIKYMEERWETGSIRIKAGETMRDLGISANGLVKLERELVREGVLVTVVNEVN